MLKSVTSSWCASALAVCLLLTGACEDDVKVRTVTATPQGDAQTPSTVVSCSGQEDGVECAVGRHCLAEKCVFNTCGDGIAAEQEQCDDGNALSNDGCTPSCVMELESCPGGGLKVVGQECPTADAGVGERPLCPMITSFKVNGRETASGTEVPFLVGETLSVQATAVGSSDKQRWIGGRGAISASGLSATIYCSAPFGADNSDLYLMLTRPDCPNSIVTIRLKCDDLPDAGLDATIPDPGPSDAGSGEGGPQDAAPRDASSTDGATDSGVPTNPFGSAACETCMHDNCTLYADILTIFEPCFKSTVSTSFSKLCTDAFVCSRKSPDNCAVAPLGAGECFCGLGVSLEVCATTATGTCKNEWYAAAGCTTAANPNDCVLQNFATETTPAGAANYALECRKTFCLTECP